MYRSGNHSVIFYQTPRTIQYNISNKSIEAFVVDSEAIEPNRSVFEISSLTDIHCQLNRTENLCGKIFSSVKSALITYFNNDVFAGANSLKRSKSVILNNANIFMGNRIILNMKKHNVTIRQFTPMKIDKNYEYRKCELSNESIYAELFNSPSMEVHDPEKHGKI